MHKTTTHLRVGVLMGGKSIEREVSFNSGRTICDHLDSSKYEIIPIFQQSNGKLYILPWRFLSRGKISDFEQRLVTDAKAVLWDELPNLIDFVYIAMHGRYAEDGTLQGMLELLNLPYLGAKLLGSAIGMDKTVQKQILSANGIDVPRGVVLTPHEIQALTKNPMQVHNLFVQFAPLVSFDRLRTSGSLYENTKITEDTRRAHPEFIEFGVPETRVPFQGEFGAKGSKRENDSNEKPPIFPLIIKPHKEGSSLGMSVVKKEEDLLPALITACNINAGMQQSVLIEEKVEGMEFTCIILTNQDGTPLLLPPTEVVCEAGSEFYTYEQKYMPGRAMKYTPARCSVEDTKLIQDVCLRVMKLLEFSNMARIDGFLTPDKRVVIIDPNTLTGMGPASFIFRQAAEAGMSHAKVINHLIDTELANAAYN